MLVAVFGLMAQDQKDKNTKEAPELGGATKPNLADKDSKGAADAVTATQGLTAPVDPNTYRIGPEDVLYIRVWKEPEFSGPVQVRPDGKFTLPIVGDIAASGLTPVELASRVTDALKSQIKEPEVMVALQSVQSKKYYITGEVNRSGIFPLVVPVTVLEALTNAGGFREFARKNKITIVRGSERIKFNFNEVIKGKKLEQNIMVKDGDYIVVP
ncbi:MAG: polysaccharide biosynthesis/export family protein [Bryobacteraceae bacterium]